MEDKEYVPYGPEWKKEIKKLPKNMIIEMLAKKGVEHNDLKEKYNRLLNFKRLA